MAHTVTRWSATLVVALCLAVAASLVQASPAAAAPAHLGAETLMIRHINAARAARGLAPLRRNVQMVRIARQWSAKMAGRGVVSHRLNLADVVDGDYRRLGENVGMMRLSGATVRTLVAELHRGFMASRGHRVHILGRYNQVGVGVHRTGDGAMWVTVNFLLGSRTGFPLYRDNAGRPSERAVNKLFLRGGIRGCRFARFCPKADATRQQMAAMVDRAARSRGASRYVSSSCGSLSSCRTWRVTKVDLAVAVAHARGLSPVSGRRFTDVKATESAAVNAVVKAGIMSGCRSTRFCSGKIMSRAAVARVANRAWR